MNRILNMLRRADRDNRGSGLVMVLVCMVCISLLAATMMQMSYIGVRIKATERTAASEFYDAAAAMEEIRAGLQEVVSDCVAESYKEALLNYSSDLSQTMKDFNDFFKDALTSWEHPELADGNNQLLLPDDTTEKKGTYNVEVLKQFIDDSNEADLVTDAADAKWEYLDGSRELVLKNVHVTYTDTANQYTTDVESDIVLSTPDFVYILSDYRIDGVPEFVLIAKDKLTQQGICQVDGSSYAGEVSLSTGSNLTVRKGYMICASDLSVNDRSASDLTTNQLTLKAPAILWTNDINVEGGGIKLLGTTYVADDLNLKAPYSSAVLGGEYFGFGSSDDKPSQSSAILINSSQTKLDMSGLSSLKLAGYSFISPSYSDPEAALGGTLMGESISTRRNQQAYLLPVSYLKNKASNPEIFNDNIKISIEDVDPQNLLTDEGKWELDTYGGKVTTIHVNIPNVNQHAVYYFINFDRGVDANAFFRSYFEKNADEISDYVNSYTTLSSSLGNVETAGYTLDKQVDDSYILHDTLSDWGDAPAKNANTFDLLKANLLDRSIKDDNDTSDNPYDYFVNTTSLAELAAETRYEFKHDDEVLGLVINGSFTVDETVESTVRVIVASGNVSVSSDFTGLIISGGTITLDTGAVNLKADGAGVVAALEATCDAWSGNPLSNIFTKTLIKGAESEEENNTGWDFNKLVFYRNWDKNGD